jgi:uridine kinase
MVRCATMNRDQLLSMLADRLEAVVAARPLRVAIDGVDAAGKTVLANELAEVMRSRGRSVVRASIDGFHNPRAVPQRQGPESPEGYFRDSFDYAALVEHLLGPMGPEGSRQYRRAVFDFRTDAAVASPLERAPDDAILLFEGVFLQRPELREHWDYRIFVAASFETTVARAMQRDQYLFGDADKVRRRYQARYVPGQKLYLAACDPESSADAVVGNDDPSAPSVRFKSQGS